MCETKCIEELFSERSTHDGTYLAAKNCIGLKKLHSPTALVHFVDDQETDILGDLL